MRKLKGIFAGIALTVFALPNLLMAQDEGTYIDNLNVQDSSYMEQDLLAGAEQSGSNTVLIVIVAVVVVAVVAFLLLRKRKK